MTSGFKIYELAILICKVFWICTYRQAYMRIYMCVCMHTQTRTYMYVWRACVPCMYVSISNHAYTHILHNTHALKHTLTFSPVKDDPEADDPLRLDSIFPRKIKCFSHGAALFSSGTCALTFTARNLGDAHRFISKLPEMAIPSRKWLSLNQYSGLYERNASEHNFARSPR